MINHHFKILSLDPSSTVIGYAVLTPERRLIQAGCIEPQKKSAPSFERIVTLGKDVWMLFKMHRPSVILVEWTKGKVGKRHHGLGAGLAVYGCGVGWVGATAYTWMQRHPECEVVPVLENDWTRGVPKLDRQIAVAQLYPAYDRKIDPGGDIADAIGLGDWWLKENLFRGEV